jgi:hypothetical protein
MSTILATRHDTTGPSITKRTENRERRVKGKGKEEIKKKNLRLVKNFAECGLENVR